MELTAALAPAVGVMLDRLEAVLTPPLFTPESVARLRRLSAGLPPSHFLLFERHLGGGARMDLSVADLTDPNAVLEFDLDGGDAPPARFVTLPGRQRTSEAALLSLAADLQGSLPGQRRAALARAVAAQREGESWITHLGTMRSRPGAPLRINIGAPSPAGLRSYARAAGCGDAASAALDRLFRLVEDLPLTFILAFDIDAAPLHRLGIECFAHPPENAGPALLERLLRRGLCDASEAEAILGWPDEGSDACVWPEPFHSLDTFLGARGRLVRTLNHVKLVAEADGGTRAKAYLAAYYDRGREPSATGMAA